MSQLNQIIAIEKGVKSRTYSEISHIHKASGTPAPFNGLTKVYRKKDDDGEEQPPQSKGVALIAEEQLRRVAEVQTELFDVVATKEWANQGATADLKVGGETLCGDVPVTYLLFLEKQLKDMRTFVDNLPVLNPEKNWTKDPNSDLFKSDQVTTSCTVKMQEALVLHPPTKEHPAQTQMITKDVIVGWWDAIHLSGAMPIPRKREILSRIDTLAKAVKQAREAANSTTAPSQKVGEDLFGYLFG